LKKKLHHRRRVESAGSQAGTVGRRQMPIAERSEARRVLDRGRGTAGGGFALLPQSPRVRHRYDDARSVFIALLVSCRRGESRTIPAVGLGPNKHGISPKRMVALFTHNDMLACPFSAHVHIPVRASGPCSRAFPGADKPESSANPAAETIAPCHLKGETERTGSAHLHPVCRWNR
jgi:hypothetical protein